MHHKTEFKNIWVRHHELWKIVENFAGIAFVFEGFLWIMAGIGKMFRLFSSFFRISCKYFFLGIIPRIVFRWNLQQNVFKWNISADKLNTLNSISCEIFMYTVIIILLQLLVKDQQVEIKFAVIPI